MNKIARLIKLSGFLALGGIGFSQAADMDKANSYDSLSNKVESIMAKEGISLGGIFRSQYMHASIGGPDVDAERANEETVQFTSVDFDIKARPNTAAQGRLIFRMHQDWRNFFSDIKNPIHTRWISLDGKFKYTSYHVGDFRAQYSPLTLYAPELDFMYEPLIFSKSRKEAMDEEFLGGNDRILQGANLKFDAEIYPILNEFHLDLIGSRLRNVETAISNGSIVTAPVEQSDVEKYLLGANTDFRFLNGVSLGGTFMSMFDKLGTYAGEGAADSMVQDDNIYSFRFGLDANRWMEDVPWSAKLDAEMATSNVNSTSLSLDSTRVDADSQFVVQKTTSTLTGSALNVSLSAGYSLEGILSSMLKIEYLKNELNYHNGASQTPTFIGEPVMNIENDEDMGTVHDYTSKFYSTSDALNHYVFKFAPSDRSNMWAKSPFQKNSYRNSILTPDELATAAGQMDPSVQLVMPFGPATPNRTGLQAKLNLGLLENKIEAIAKFASLSEVEGVEMDSLLFPASTFTEFGVGAKVHVDKFLGWEKPLYVAGSFTQSQAKNDGIPASNISAITTKVNLIHADFFWTFFKRTSLLFGAQMFETSMDMGAISTTLSQSNLAVGLDYKISSGVYAMFSLGQNSVSQPELPDATDPANPIIPERDFHQLFTTLALRVNF